MFVGFNLKDSKFRHLPGQQIVLQYMQVYLLPIFVLNFTFVDPEVNLLSYGTAT